MSLFDFSGCCGQVPIVGDLLNANKKPSSKRYQDYDENNPEPEYEESQDQTPSPPPEETRQHREQPRHRSLLHNTARTVIGGFIKSDDQREVVQALVDVAFHPETQRVLNQILGKKIKFKI